MDSVRPLARLKVAAGQPVPLSGSECPWLAGCQRLRTADPQAPMTVEVVLRHPKPVAEPGAFRTAPGSDLAASPEQLRAVEAFARANGLKVGEVDAESRTVRLDGTAAQQQKAFGVQLAQYRTAEGAVYRGYDGTIKLPTALAAQVEGVLGLDDHPVAQPHFVRASAQATGFTPPQVAQMYNFPLGVSGRGQTIGIVELGGGYKPEDLQTYFRQLNIPQPSVTDVSVDLGHNSPTGNPDSADGEVCLDIDVAGAVAPNSNLRVYFAPNLSLGFANAIKKASKECNVVSISWGGPEDRWSGMMRNVMNSALQDAAARGVNVFCASGDNGSGDGLSGKHVDFPASSPYSIGCGGTHFESIANETVWNDGAGHGATGGGVSSIFAQPGYQSGSHVPAPGGRGVPDVAGDASPRTGYLIRADGQEFTVGGTSAVAPLWSGLTALLAEGAGRPLGYLNPFLYQHPEAFHDIRVGNNGDFSAAPGWDATTGQGSPDGSRLLEALRAA
ncbi:MAG: S53 family peptidase, partial [Candidatus Xenobia bacterium]